jgi:two-component system sensor histidine kinase TctE
MSLRSHLLRWLLIPLVLLWAVGFRISYLRSLDQANEAYDRTLLGSALAIAERASIRDGALSVDVPSAALEMLETRSQDRIFYKVSCVEPKLAPTGHDDLPAPQPLPQADRPVFADALYHDEAIRMVALIRPLYDASVRGPLLIQVAETTAARRALSRRIVIDAAITQLALIAAAAALIAFGVQRGLGPLRQLRDEVRSRGGGDLTPIGTRSVPREVAPLIEAINVHTLRQRQLNESHRQFIADASHQLKTPLTVLKTQATLALQQSDPAAVRGIVQDIHDATDATSRVVAQLLALARSEAGQALAAEPLDLVEVARGASFDLLERALGKTIEIEFHDQGAVRIDGLPLLLRELAANLIDNAIRYLPAGGRIVVSVLRDEAGRAVLTVEDDGPGIAPAHRARVFDRFYRIGGSPGDGAGLGLAIVAQIATLHHAQVALDSAQAGRGLRVTVAFPASGPRADGPAQNGS